MRSNQLSYAPISASRFYHSDRRSLVNLDPFFKAVGSGGLDERDALHFHEHAERQLGHLDG